MICGELWVKKMSSTGPGVALTPDSMADDRAQQPMEDRSRSLGPRRRCARSSELWHAMMFYTEGEFLRRDLAELVSRIRSRQGCATCTGVNGFSTVTPLSCSGAHTWTEQLYSTTQSQRWWTR